MGRAFLFVICSVLFTLTPLNHVYTDNKVNEWTSFTLQYKYLVDDGKYELAERMLNSRLPQMERYVETLPDEQKEQWHNLLVPLLNDESETYSMDMERFITYVQAVTTEDPYQYIRQETSELQAYLDNVFIPLEYINSEWERLAPTLEVFYPNENFEELSMSVSLLAASDAVETRENAAFHFAELIEPSSSMTVEAILWTAVMIGGTIIMTLAYVALRKFKATVAKGRSYRGENS